MGRGLPAGSFSLLISKEVGRAILLAVDHVYKGRALAVIIGYGDWYLELTDRARVSLSTQRTTFLVPAQVTDEV